MAMITNDWLPALQRGVQKAILQEIIQTVKEEYSRTVVYPPAEDIFNAFHFTPLSEVKVLILGQDPYHNVTSGTWSFVFCAAGAEGNAALPAEYL